eukprot:GHVU01103640.1.p2 GENE.GHVU01103640.1~~GHVU01103640.1.p2  ORF type:complete len:140 (+),score=2.87 GHVU01103640.1:677-1096(+)
MPSTEMLYISTSLPPISRILVWSRFQYVVMALRCGGLSFYVDQWRTDDTLVGAILYPGNRGSNVTVVWSALGSFQPLSAMNDRTTSCSHVAYRHQAVVYQAYYKEPASSMPASSTPSPCSCQLPHQGEVVGAYAGSVHV